MVDSITGKKSCLNLCLCAFMAETSNSKGKREVYMLNSHSAISTLTISYFQNINVMIAENANTCNIPFHYK